ncbi:MAG: DUF192 domain-containing protein [Myxococcota bacterium]
MIGQRLSGFGLALLLACSGTEGPPVTSANALEPVVPGEPREGTIRVTAQSGDVRIRVELAVRAFDRERGLMFRRYLPRDRGMLFVFEEMGPREFHMENTFVPLDVLFIDAERRVVGIRPNRRPLSLDGISVEAPSQYVLEVHAGFAERYGVRVGSQVHFEDFDVRPAENQARPDEDGSPEPTHVEEAREVEGSRAEE